MKKEKVTTPEASAMPTEETTIGSFNKEIRDAVVNVLLTLLPGKTREDIIGPKRRRWPECVSARYALLYLLDLVATFKCLSFKEKGILIGINTTSPHSTVHDIYHAFAGTGKKKYSTLLLAKSLVDQTYTYLGGISYFDTKHTLFMPNDVPLPLVAPKPIQKPVKEIKQELQIPTYEVRPLEQLLVALMVDEEGCLISKMKFYFLKEQIHHHSKKMGISTKQNLVPVLAMEETLISMKKNPAYIDHIKEMLSEVPKNELSC